MVTPGGGQHAHCHRLLAAPRLAGIPQVGYTLVLTPGWWANSTTQTETWVRCGGPSLNMCSSIGRIGDWYVLTTADLYDLIEVVETATGPGGSLSTGAAIGPVQY
jgi:hypothetical protein